MRNAKIMVSQLHPHTLICFFKCIRKEKEYSKEEVIIRIEKLGENQARLPILISELIGILNEFQVIDYNQARKTFVISNFGLLLKSILLRNEGLFFEIYHLINYYAFDLYEKKDELLPFKSYRLICDNIFNRQKKPDSKELAYEVESILVKEDNVTGAFDESCIARALTWLRHLSPPVLEEGEFINRIPLHIEPILWNLNLAYKCKGIKYGDPLFLDNIILENISRASLMDSNKLNSIFLKLAKKYPDIINLRTSVSGTYLILMKEVRLDEIL